MDFRLSFTIESSEQIENNIDYLLEYWSEKVASEFIKKIISKGSFIREFPNLYPLTKFRMNVRRCVVTKQITMYYKNFKNGILVISVFDTRQSPERLNL